MKKVEIKKKMTVVPKGFDKVFTPVKSKEVKKPADTKK